VIIARHAPFRGRRLFVTSAPLVVVLLHDYAGSHQVQIQASGVSGSSVGTHGNAWRSCTVRERWVTERPIPAAD
jgi:hypothetical protein